MAQVELKGVCKRFGTVEVVHDVNLDIHDNEFIVLVGPSGCGKSTILRMIAGLEKLSGGAVSIGGKVVNNVPPKDRDVAMVFQNYALYPHMTVADNMDFGLKMRKMKPEMRAAKVKEAAEVLELTDYLARKPAALSGGQRQRVAMGRAIVRNAEVFLFDEPLSNLDAQLRTQMRMELKKLHHKLETTTIYVTHDQIEAMTLADRIVILKDGRVQQVGTPIDVFENPVNVFVARFIGNPPMNIFSGTYHKGPGSVSVKAGELELSVPPERDPGLQDNAEVIIGIRPDAIKVEKSCKEISPDWCRRARVTIAEIVGGQSLIELELGGNTLIAEVEGRIVAKPGEEMEIGFELGRMILFDPETTKALPVKK